jgi:tetraacyldisaccharide 4'-kinase
VTERAAPLPAVLGRALEPLYAFAVARRNRRFDRGRGMVTMDRPVISVGNLTVGGTGKTPMVMHLARRLRGDGLRPCIAMRGYRASSTPGSVSDEAAQYRDELGDIPIVARPDRVEGLIHLFATEKGAKVNCVLLDDGFQHRRLARQMDIVMVDATRDPFLDRLLPAGWLREPLSALKRARWVVLTHAESAPSSAVYRLGLELRKIDAGIRIAITRHVWTELMIENGRGIDCREVGWLKGRDVLAVCAIGNPNPFLSTLEAAVGKSVDRIVLRDHDPYSDRTIRRVRDAAQGCDALVTTAKDWAKLVREPIGNWPCLVVRPHLVLAFDAGQAELEQEVLAAAKAPPP